MAVCLSCNKQVRVGKFCPDCGRQVADESTNVESSPTVNEPSATSKAMWAHLGAAIGFGLGFVLYFPFFLLWVPGFVIRMMQNTTDFEKKHAEESLNFQLTLLLVNVAGVAIGFLTLFIGFIVAIPLLLLLNLGALVLMIMGTLAATGGKEFRYPLTIRFVK